MMSQPQHAVPPFGILGINNINPRHAGNPPSKSSKQGAGATGQLPPIPVTNPSARVGRHGGEGGEGERKQASTGSAKKRTPYLGDRAHALANTDETLPVWCMPDTDDDSVFADSSRTPRGEAESEGEEEATAAAPVAKKRRASNPYRPGCCSTLLFSSLHHQYPKDLPRGQHSSSRSGYPEQPRRRRPVRSFRRMIW